LRIENFKPIAEEFVLTEIASCPPSISIDHVINFFNISFSTSLFNSFGGTLLAVRDWAHQGSPRAAVGFGPKA
jgi:hypothetical protein